MTDSLLLAPLPPRNGSMSSADQSARQQYRSYLSAASVSQIELQRLKCSAVHRPYTLFCHSVPRPLTQLQAYASETIVCVTDCKASSSPLSSSLSPCCRTAQTQAVSVRGPQILSSSSICLTLRHTLVWQAHHPQALPWASQPL